MNKIRRKQLQEASELIAKAQEIIESVKDDDKEIEQDAKCAELPKKEEMAEQRELIKQFMAAGNQIDKEAAEFLKDIFKG